MSIHPHPISRKAAALLVAALSAVLIVGVSAPANAATTDVSLKSALADPSTTLVTLENAVIITDSSIPVDATNITLDLAGFDLTTKNIDLDTGVHLTIIDSTNSGAILTATADSGKPGIETTGATLTLASGVIHASGGTNGAGIGGGGGSDNGAVVINGATVVATGGTGGAGIGGGVVGDGSNITISAGTVTANGGGNAAGIGGGNVGNGHDITISGGTVTATGGYLFTGGAGIGGGGGRAAWNLTFSGGTTSAFGATNAAGIGTGEASTGTASAITIGVGAVVNATSGGGGNPLSGYPYPSAVGGGENNISNGAVTIAGTLNVFGHLRHNGYSGIGGAITIESTGVLGGTADIRGQNGQIINHGSITAPNLVNSADTGGGVSVTDHSYIVSYVAPDATPSGNNPRLYATSLAAGEQSLWTGLVRTGWVLAGWALPSNAPFTTTTAVSSNITVHAVWTAGSIVSSVDNVVVSPGSASTTAGVDVAFTVEGFDINDDSLGDFTSSAVWTSNDSTAVITDGTFHFTKAGLHTATATVGTKSDTVNVTVAADVANDVSLELSATTVKQGDSLTFEAWTVDQFGNRITNVSSTVVVTSDQPTDVVTGTTVTFPHASPHVITATLGAFSASVLVQVSPAALAATGVNLMIPLLLAVALLLLGAALLLWRLVRTREGRAADK